MDSSAALIAECPTPEYHETHRYCPSCPWTEPQELLAERVVVAFTLAHVHPGIAGVPEGSGCLRCNAEKALDELVRRSKRHA